MKYIIISIAQNVFAQNGQKKEQTSNKQLYFANHWPTLHRFGWTSSNAVLAHQPAISTTIW